MNKNRIICVPSSGFFSCQVSATSTLDDFKIIREQNGILYYNAYDVHRESLKKKWFTHGISADHFHFLNFQKFLYDSSIYWMLTY